MIEVGKITKERRPRSAVPREGRGRSGASRPTLEKVVDARIAALPSSKAELEKIESG
jgi:hypothetical protein